MVIIIRYAEIALKGKNRAVFEKRLVSNIADAFKKNNAAYDEISRVPGRILVYAEKADFLKNVFGISSFSYAQELDFDIEKIKKKALEMIKDKQFESFRVTSTRSDKSLPITSMELDKKIGGFLAVQLNKRVSLKEFDLELCIDLINGKAFAYFERTDGYGGLPLGVEGKVCAQVNDEKDLLAAWYMMRRGCEVVLTGKQIDYSWLEKFAYGQELGYGSGDSCLAIATGQLIDEIADVDSDLTLLRPLIVFTKQQVEEKINELK